MSSTYVSGVYAAALRRSSGYAYAMFFETCESNVVPRKPRWRPQYLGSLAEVLSEMVEYVDCCDDGLTKGARGRPITSAAFVRKCERALASAALITEHRTNLSFGRGYRDIEMGKLAQFDALATGAGINVHYSREGDPLGSNSASRTVDLGDPATVDVVLAFHRDAKVPLWQLLDIAGMAHLPSQGDWTPPAASARELAQTTAAVRAHLAEHRVVNMRCPWPNGDYVQEEQLVLDQQQHVVQGNPLRWFCSEYLGGGRATKLGQSTAALKAFAAWRETSVVTLDANDCIVMATAKGSTIGAQASIKPAGGGSQNLPAQLPAASVFRDLRYCEAAQFNIISPELAPACAALLL